MKIAVEGCCHGELDKIYAAMRHLEQREGITIDLLICCGDFQAVRNIDDLECMSVPNKYKQLATFHKYYSGETRAPYPTLFIGGNHEASNYLWELYYGGFVCPNVYYLGHSGVVNFGNLRVGGLSGIYKSNDYRRAQHERPPYSSDTLRSAYHVREFDVKKLKSVTEPLDVFLSHDWPRNVAKHGDVAGLTREKPFLRREIEDSSLGSPPGEDLLNTLQPSYWFAAHLHVKFAALVDHGNGRHTKFLALDKCLPKRDFMQIIDLPDKSAGDGFWLDPEWLGILRANHLNHPIGNERNANARVADRADRVKHRAWVDARLASETETETDSETRAEARLKRPPFPFAPTAPAHAPSDRRRPGTGDAPRVVHRNPQTVALLDFLELDFKLDSKPKDVTNVANVANVANVRRFPLPPPQGPFGSLVPRNLPPPPRVADKNEIDLPGDEPESS